jgi:hypothetical protein
MLRLFHPSCCSGGRSKSLRWADDDGEDTEDDRPASYLDAVLRPVRLVAASKPLASGADAVRQGPVRQQGRRSQPRPKLVHGLPARQVEGRIPAHQRLGHHGRVSAPNSDGWREILQRPVTQPAAVSSGAHRPQARRIPAELVGICFNCLSYSHRVATCRLPRRCLRCRGFRHIARDCRRPRRPEAASTVVGANSLPHVHAPIDGAAQEVVGGHQRHPASAAAVAAGQAADHHRRGGRLHRCGYCCYRTVLHRVGPARWCVMRGRSAYQLD